MTGLITRVDEDVTEEVDHRGGNIRKAETRKRGDELDSYRCF